MHLKELNHRNPMRAFERAVHGGLGRGNLGLVLGRAGVGKSAFLTGLALDHLLRGQRVLHVTLDRSLERIRERYDEIFADLARSANLEERALAHETIERNRIIRSFAGQDFSVEKLAEAISVFGTHADFQPDLIIVAGHDHDRPSGPEEIAGILENVRRVGAECWMPLRSRRLAPNEDWRELPEAVKALGDLPSVIVLLHPVGEWVRIRLLKDHDNEDLADLDLDLDPTTFLVQGG